jgi:FixJ family two-component response regulator
MRNVGHSTAQSVAPLIGIVDDDQSVRDSISSLVRSTGFRSATFESAEAILNSESRYEADCLILDVRMPGLSGLGLQSRLAEVKCTTPIIFITAHSSEEERDQALRRGAIAFLGKPFGEEALLSAIQSALEPSGLEDEGEEHVRNGPSKPS